MSAGGWPEPIPGTGIRRDHRVACQSSHDRKRGRRCGCPYSFSPPQVNGSKGRRVTGVPSLAEAKQRKQALEAVAADQRRAPTASARGEADETVAEFYARWMRRNEHRWSPATVETRDRAYRRYVHGHIDDLAVGDIATRTLEDWIDALLDGTNGHTAVKQAFVTIRAMLGTAAKRRIIEWNPALAVEFPPPPAAPTPRDHLLIDEYRQLLDACPSLRDRAIVRLAAEGALRRGELCALRWSHLELDGRHPSETAVGLVTVCRTITRSTGKKLVDGPTKGKNLRVASVSSHAVRDLAEYREELIGRHAHDEAGYVFPSGRARRITDVPVDPMTMTHRGNRLVKLARLVDEHGNAMFSLQDFRRTAATLARDHGVAEDVIRDQLGHSTTAVTRGHYIRTQVNPRIEHFAGVFEELGV